MAENPMDLSVDVEWASDEVSVSSLFDVLRNAERLFTCVSDEMSDVRTKWRVGSLRMSSPLSVSFFPRAKKGIPPAGATKTILDGLDDLQQGSQRPKFFSNEALRSALALVEILGRSAVSIQMRSRDHDPVFLTRAVAASCDSLLGVASGHVEWATFEGTLDGVNLHDDERRRIHLYDVLTDERIDCEVDEDVDLEAIKRSLTRRVVVSGIARYSSDGRIRMKVDEFETIPEDHELPTIDDIKGTDITGGLSSEEYVRRLRDGE